MTAEPSDDVIAALDALDSVDHVTDRDADDGFRIVTTDNVLTTEIMRVLSDSGYSVEPSPTGGLHAKPESSGMLLAFPPEFWSEIVRQYEELEAVLGDPVESVRAAEALVEAGNNEYESVTEAVEELRDLRDLWAIFHGKLSEEQREELRKFEGSTALSAEDLHEASEYRKTSDGEVYFGITEPARPADAAAAVNGEDLPTLPEQGTKKRLVLETLASEGAMFTGEVVEASGYENAGVSCSVLKADGLLEVVGERGDPPAKENKWQVTDAAERALGVEE